MYNTYEYTYPYFKALKADDVMIYKGSSHPTLKKDTIAVIESTFSTFIVFKNNIGEWALSAMQNWRLVKTKPGSEAEPGDDVIRIARPPNKGSIGDIYYNIPGISKEHPNFIEYTENNITLPQNIKVLVKQHNNIKKEQTMKNDVTITVNGREIPVSNPETAACLISETDLESRKAWTITIFNPNGSYNRTEYFTSRKQAIKATKKILQNPEGLGYTLVLHKEIEAYTTNVPVIKIS